MSALARKNTVLFLEKVYKVIEKGWCRGYAAKKRNGEVVYVGHPGATNYCLSGACSVVLNKDFNGDSKKIWLACDILNKKVLQLGYWGIANFNDNQKDKRPVLRLLMDCIAEARK